MTRTGIMGGTFDPIHIGHLILAETAYEEAGLDRVLLMPTGVSYFKEDQKVTDPQLRLKMTEAAAAGNPHFEASDIEVRRSGNTYTCETLRQLKKERPDEEFYYIVGADTLVMMSLWKEPESIFRDCTILVETRGSEVSEQALKEEIRKLREKYAARIIPLSVRNMDISSTDIRERVSDGRSIRYLVPEAVEEIIRENGLYQ